LSRTIPCVSELPYRQPSPAVSTLDEYFVKVQADAEQKGPYTLSSLRKSLKSQVLKDGTLVRAAGSPEWIPLRALIPKNAGIPKKAFRAEDPRDLERAIRSAQDPTIGVGLIVAGLVLSALSLGLGSGRGTIFLGLIAVGVARLLKGREG
jgi:GYF domain 2